MLQTVDSVFVLICSLFILGMIPAIGIFYAGLGTEGSAVDSIIKCWLSIGVVTLLWFICGFSLAFGEDHWFVVGSDTFFLLENVGIFSHPELAPTIPFLVFFLLQTSFAVLATAFASGGVAERMEWRAYLLFQGLWSLLVYIPLVHMVWGGGLLQQIGLLDYGGGAVIHMSAGFSALAASMVLGKRNKKNIVPHEMGYTVIGCGFLFFGWLAANGSCSMGINGSTVYALVNSLLGAASGMILWFVIAAFREKRPSVQGILWGCLAGLVGITPGAAYVNPQKAVLIGGAVSAVCFICREYSKSFSVEDTLSVWAIHGAGGFAGLVLTGFFADPTLLAIPFEFGAQVMNQLGGGAAVALFAFGMTWLLLKGISRIFPLRVSEVAEQDLDGLVYREHIRVRW